MHEDSRKENFRKKRDFIKALKDKNLQITVLLFMVLELIKNVLINYMNKFRYMYMT